MTATPDRRLGRRWAGWGIGPAIVAAMTALVAFSWAPLMTQPLATNHLGNVAARHGLHVRNLFQDGLVGSSFGAAWEPYRSEPYAHHPPLLNALQAIVGLLPGDATVQLRIAPYALALAAVPAAAWMLRSLELSWSATLLSTGAFVGTGYYWVYGPIGFELSVIFALAAATTWLGRADRPTTPRIAGIAALAAVATITSWPAVAFVWALVALLLRRRSADGASVSVAIGALTGTAVTTVYVVGISGWGSLVDQTETRSTGGTHGSERFLEIVGGHVGALLPTWFVVLFVPAIALGVVDRRTRSLTAVSSVFAVAWLVVLNEGAVVHDYWGYPLVIPGLLGIGALVDRALAVIGSGRPTPTVPVVVGAAGVVLLVNFGILATGSTADRYLHRPAEAGAVIAAATPPDGQTTAWSVGLPYGRVLSYEWRMPTREITDVDLDSIGADEIIFVDATPLPTWWPSAAPPMRVAGEDDYFIVTVGALAEALENDPTEL